jgi:hypothetical protein
MEKACEVKGRASAPVKFWQRKGIIMARTKTNITTDLITRGPATGSALIEDLSNLLRSLMHVLGTAYCSLDTAPATIEKLEAAKVNVLEARRAANGDNA